MLKKLESNKHEIQLNVFVDAPYVDCRRDGLFVGGVGWLIHSTIYNLVSTKDST